MLRTLNVPLASSYTDIGDLPARVVQDYEIMMAGIADAQEWMRLDSERNAGKK